MKRKRRHDDEPPRRRDSVAPDEFCEWWNPTGIAEPSGASIGGHHDAERVWARKDPGRWTRRTYGITATIAWTCAIYRREFNRWIEADRPEREEFVSVCATPERQVEFAKQLKATLAQIGKPMPTEDKQPLPKPPVKGHLMDNGECEPIEF